MPKDQGPGLAGLIKAFLFESPKGWGEALWRGAALWLVTTALSCAYMVTQKPHVLEALFAPDEKSRALEDVNETKKKAEIEQLVEAFVYRRRPDRFALIARVSNVGVKLIWSNEDARRWPTAVEGAMSANMRPIIGHLELGECWIGPIDGSETRWQFCGISDADHHHGYIVASWDSGPQPNSLADMKLLAQRIGEILF